jgi:toxin YoeB
VKVLFSRRAAEEYRYWQKTDSHIWGRINRLLHDIDRDPFRGIGKPEPLRHDLAGCWSRRITGAHRLVYKIENGNIVVVQCRYHYDR